MNTPSSPAKPSYPWVRIPEFAVLVILTVVWDLYTKWWAFETYGLPMGYELWWSGFWGEFSITTNLNHGALWGFGQGKSYIFASLSSLVLIGVPYYLFGVGVAKSHWLNIALGFVTGGTIGNLYDRLGMHGIRDAEGKLQYAVRDFLHFDFRIYDYPIFNFADSFLVTGVIMMMIYFIFLEPAPIDSKPKQSTPPNPEPNPLQPSNPVQSPIP